MSHRENEAITYPPRLDNVGMWDSIHEMPRKEL